MEEERKEQPQLKSAHNQKPLNILEGHQAVTKPTSITLESNKSREAKEVIKLYSDKV